MRLKAFEYWKCAETGLATGDSTIGSVKFVIAEALPDQGGKAGRNVAMGMDVELLKRNGILMDTEKDVDTLDEINRSRSQHKSEVRYLMQKFTRPLFDRDTFFLEVIQRVGATGPDKTSQLL
nr:hypothetical protein BaRGS_015509 [Batillaria attramentaria]